MSKQDDYQAHEGRLVDGWAYAVRMKDGSTVRVCDQDGPQAVWARIQREKLGTESSAKGDGDAIIFSGARSVPNGKIDGFAIYPAKEIVGLALWGPSAMGLDAARLAKLEEGQDEIRAAIAEHMNRIEELENDLDDEDEAAEGEGGTVTPLPTAEVPAPVGADAEGDGVEG